MMLNRETEIQVLENSDYVAALERVLHEAKIVIALQPCHAHDRRPCQECLVGQNDLDDLRELVAEAELLR